MNAPEYLIIDSWTERNRPWRLLGNRLENGHFYSELTPDADGGLTFPTVGLRFVGRGRETVDVYDVATGQWLPPPEQWQETARQAVQARQNAENRAEAEAARAEAEATARANTEAELAQVTARLRELEARYGADQPSQ